MVGQKFGGRFGNEDVNTAVYGIECNGIMSCVWSEDRDSVPGRQSINSRYVCIRIVGCGVRRK